MEQALLDNDNTYKIPAWNMLRRDYDSRWEEEKEKFHNQLKENFRNLVSQWRSGKQEIFVLTENTYSKHTLQCTD